MRRKSVRLLTIAAAILASAGVPLAASSSTETGRGDRARCGGQLVAGKPAARCSSTGFVHVCGQMLCLGGSQFIVDGATAYGTYSESAREVALARWAHLNVLELVEFDSRHHVLGDVESETTWKRVDRFIATAEAAHLHVILNLSEYGQSLLAAGIAPATIDWRGYLRFIADRRNSVSGILYKNDPAIAMIDLYGEINPPRTGSDPGGAGNTRQITDFFKRTLAEWRTLAPQIPVSTGGFSYLGYRDSGIDWRAIVRDPNNATCDDEVNSQNDLGAGVPALTSFCRSLGKPWLLSAWSSCYGNPARGYNYFRSDAAMARHARSMYRLAAGGPPAAKPAAGSVFWNLQNGPAVSGTCAIGPSFPLTLAAVRSGAGRG
jgi:hypothetical protein